MSNSKKMPLHEWLAVLVIILAMILLTVVALFNQNDSLPEHTGQPHFIAPQEIEITVEGAVENPGIHQLKKGARVKDALLAAKTLPEADISKLKLESKLRDGRVIKVPYKAMITIYLQGAVEVEGVLKVKKGTRLNELVNIAVFSPLADLSALNKKRRLKDGETIHVPERKGD